MDDFSSLKISKGAGYDVISSNVIKQCFGTLNRPLYYVCSISVQSGVFLEEIEIAKVTPIFKGGEVYDLENIQFLFYVFMLLF